MENGTKWTPGPWKIESDINANEAAADDLVLTPDGGYVIAQCGADATVLPWDQIEANARLVAAAPELYDAVRLALDVVHAPHGALEAECPDVVCRQFRAALAKAEG